MADSTFLSSAGAKDVATLIQTQLANCVYHLFQSSFSPTPTSVLADFLAAECNFDGYAPLTIVSWSDPVLAGSAWAIYAPTQTIRWTFAGPGNTNMVGGYFIVTAGGDLQAYTVADPAEGLSGPGQAFIRTPINVFPWG